ncbi:hypothetical protein KFU94_07525, partial [Chloroflexi bacterium TSY]|nr:hypothetical protein [Chloroflexi bacterium TSY]
QPPEIEQFLLHTSILGRISAELCNRVTQQVNSRTIIERIDAANLFLIPLDGKREWFRYHHLFSDLLQERLTQQIPTEAINTLHLQASLWFEEHRYIEEAIEHALTAQDFERAISLITPFGDAVLHGEGRALLVNQWARKIPDSHLHRYPGLTVSVVLSSLIVWDIEWAERNLKALPSPADLPPVHHAIYLLLQGNMALSFRNIKRARHLLMEAMAVAPEENLPLQLGIREQMITFLLNTEELLEARGFAQEGLELADAADHLGWKLTMQTILGTIALDRGQLYQAADICRSVIERVQRYTRRVTADTAADAHVYLGRSSMSGTIWPALRNTIMRQFV